MLSALLSLIAAGVPAAGVAGIFPCGSLSSAPTALCPTPSKCSSSNRIN